MNACVYDYTCMSSGLKTCSQNLTNTTGTVWIKSVLKISTNFTDMYHITFNIFKVVFVSFPRHIYDPFISSNISKQDKQMGKPCLYILSWSINQTNISMIHLLLIRNKVKLLTIIKHSSPKIKELKRWNLTFMLFCHPRGGELVNLRIFAFQWLGK